MSALPNGSLPAVCVLGVGLLGPGLDDWTHGAALLRQSGLWQSRPTVVPPPARLPATERRRAGAVVKASILVADQALAMAGLDAATLPTVFTSSTGDPSNCHLLCEALAQPERMVSPTRFTNSVHNAPAGYWHIAAQSMQASTSLAGYDASFGAGLLEAVVQCLATQRPVLLVACDVPYPEPLHTLRPVSDVLATALVLAPMGDGDRRGRGLQLSVGTGGAATPCQCTQLESLRGTIPAARALPLLEALAGPAERRLSLELIDGLAGTVHVAAAQTTE